MPKRRPSILESVIGGLILIGLVAIGITLRRDSAIRKPERFSSNQGGVARGEERDENAAWELPAQWKLVTSVSAFGPERLYEKINGRAEFYLENGFRRLETATVSPTDATNKLFDVYVYEMASPRHAYAAYSLQQRDDAQYLPKLGYAYHAENAFFGVRGSRYIEIIGSEEGPEFARTLIQLADDVLKLFPDERLDLSEAELLPKAHRLPGIVRLYVSGFPGFAVLSNAVMADYQIGEDEASAFICAVSSPQQAAELVRRCQDELVREGATLNGAITNVAGAVLYRWFGSWSTIFARNSIVAGVHQASTPEAASELAKLIQRNLPGDAP